MLLTSDKTKGSLSMKLTCVREEKDLLNCRILAKRSWKKYKRNFQRYS